MYSVVDKLFLERFNGVFVLVSYNGVFVEISISGALSLVSEFDLLVNRSFSVRLWYVACHKTRVRFSSFCKLVRFLVAPISNIPT